MKIPPRPPVGHVIAYEYLWASQENATEDGRAAYPAAIIMARDDLGPAPIAYALGISHSPPKEGQRAMLMPPKLKRHLGLDDLPSWVVVCETNDFLWPGPDLRPADPAYGMLPPRFFAHVRDRILQAHARRKLSACSAPSRALPAC